MTSSNFKARRVLRERSSPFGSFALAAQDPSNVCNRTSAPQRLRGKFSPFLLAQMPLRRLPRKKAGMPSYAPQQLHSRMSKVAGISNNLRLTQRALDGGYAPRFLAVSSPGRNPVSTANPRSHPPQVTPTVRQPESK